MISKAAGRYAELEYNSDETMMVNTNRFFLTDGQFLVTTVPAFIHTVLGSCVSVCLWDQERGAGGMNHYLLPGSKDNPRGTINQGYTSTRTLIRAMLNRGARRERVAAKIFGGANCCIDSVLFSVAVKNIEMAKIVLAEEGLKIVSENTGGRYGRKIVFNTATGSVKVYRLNNSPINAADNKGFDY